MYVRYFWWKFLCFGTCFRLDLGRARCCTGGDSGPRWQAKCNSRVSFFWKQGIATDTNHLRGQNNNVSCTIWIPSSSSANSLRKSLEYRGNYNSGNRRDHSSVHAAKKRSFAFASNPVRSFKLGCVQSSLYPSSAGLTWGQAHQGCVCTWQLHQLG